MKSILAVTLSLAALNSFAQGPGGYPPGTKGNPYPANVQVVSVQPGTSTFIQALVPTQVFCQGSGFPGGGPIQPAQRLVQFYTTDDCSSGFLAQVQFTGNATVDEQTCRTKATAAGFTQVWGVRENGECRNISDTNFTNACIGQM